MPRQTLVDEQEFVYTVDTFKSINKKIKQELSPKEIGYDAYNARYDEEIGSISKRKNRAKYFDMSTLGTSQIFSMFRYYKNSDATKYFIISYDTTLKKGDDLDGVFTDIKTGLTADLKSNFLTYKDRCYIVNGTDSNLCYDGSAVEDMGVPTPAAPTLELGAAGVLSGAYYYKVTYMLDDYQEGNASAASAIINPSSQKVTVTIPVSSNTRASDRKIYRTKAGGSVYYLLTTVSDNTTTSYSDNTADGDLGTAEAPTDYGAPASYKYICLHKSRAFLARNATYKSRIIFSDVRSGTAYPDVFPANNYLNIGEDDGDEITFILEDNFGQLIIGKENSIRKLHTDSANPAGWEIGGILSVQGCAAPYSAASTPFGIIYLTKYGENKKRLMLFSGQTAKPIFEEIEPILTAIPEARLDEVDGHYHNGSYYFSYPDLSATSGLTYNTRVLIIDLLTNSISIDKKNIASFCSWNSGTDKGEIYSGTSDNTGFCYREDSEDFDLEITLKSEIDEGTFLRNASSGGTESAPTIILNSNILTSVGASVISTLTTKAISEYTGEEDTIKPCGVYTSPVLLIDAVNLYYIYWTETLGSYGDVLFWIRVGDTIAETEAASWNGPYTNPAGSDISAVAGKIYIQYKVKLFMDVTNIDNYSEVYLSKNTYVVKIASGKGQEAESAIDLEWISGWNDFGELGANFKRVQKQLMSYRIDFERSSATGTLTFSYYFDGSATAHDTVSIDLATYASDGYYSDSFPLTAFCKKFKYRFYNNDAEDITIKSLELLVSPQPLYVKL